MTNKRTLFKEPCFSEPTPQTGNCRVMCRLSPLFLQTEVKKKKHRKKKKEKSCLTMSSKISWETCVGYDGCQNVPTVTF